ncbi:MAG: IS3 family transposase, partial [Thermodesulfovibrionales bacterium]|nr:IS3 family transposase [Thermodesulfovibrionales bacterium]
VAARCAMIKTLRLRYPVPILCRGLEVSVSGYYRWVNRKPSKRQQEDAILKIEIQAAHRRTRCTFGAERLQKEMAEQGVPAGIYRIRKLRKELGIKCKQTKKYKATTDSDHKLPVAENLLMQEFKTESPNEVWVSDITYISTDEGWLYLAGHKDIYTGEIVGYAMSERITRELVSRSLFKAVAAKRPSEGLIHHSDRGIQYCAHDYIKLLKQFGIKASMSRKGNCYDNAPMESFWGTLKQELVYHRNYSTRQEAIEDITEYIEIFYNRQRKQKRLDYLSPAVYEKKFYENRIAA